MVFVKITYYPRQIVARFGQMLRFAGDFLSAPRGFDVKIRDVPFLDEPANGIGRLESVELAKSFDRENVGGNALLFSGQFLVALVEIFFVGNGVTVAILEVKEVKRTAVAPSLVTKYLAFDDRMPLRSPISRL